MKSLIFIGIILFGIGALLFYMNNMAVDLRVIYGALCGIGIGLIFGGIGGYISKGSAVKQAKKKEEFLRLRKENAKLEKQQTLTTQEDSNRSNFS